MTQSYSYLPCYLDLFSEVLGDRFGANIFLECLPKQLLELLILVKIMPTFSIHVSQDVLHPPQS